MLHISYIFAQVQIALDDIEPAIAPKDVPIFPDEIMRRLQLYKDMAVAIEDFEAWMKFLERLTVELDLNPTTDYPKLAGILNQYRVAENKEPL